MHPYEAWLNRAKSKGSKTPEGTAQQSHLQMLCHHTGFQGTTL